MKENDNKMYKEVIKVRVKWDEDDVNKFLLCFIFGLMINLFFFFRCFG